MRTNCLLIKEMERSFPMSGMVLKNINLRFPNGITALLGPNGSGKTTLLRCLANIIPFSKGLVRWNGDDIRKAGLQYRHNLGYLPQEFAGYGHMSVEAFLGYMAALKLLPTQLVPLRIHELLVLLGLTAQATTPLRHLSGGTLQRVGLAQALLNDPDLLLLDEPTAGMDLEERSKLIELLRTLARDRVIVFSTHLATDAEAGADSAVILQDGRVLLHQTLEELLEHVSGRVWSIRLGDLAQLPSGCILSRLVARDDRTYDVRVVSLERPSEAASLSPPSLEDAYLAVVSGLV